MGSDSPAAVLVDQNSHEIVFILDGSVYRVPINSKIARASDGTLIDPATEGGNLATIAGKDFATQTTLAAIKAKTDNLPSDPAREGGNLSTLAGKDFATQTTLVQIMSTNGVKKIVDALPVGDNTIGRVRIIDAEGNEADISSEGRIKVEASITSAGAGVLYADLLNGTSRNMNVNGSGTPQVFSWSPGASYDVEGVSLNFVMEEPTISFGSSFFGITALTNGLLIEAKAEDRTYSIANFKLTREVVQFTTSGGFDLYSATPDLAKVLIGLGGIKFKKTGTYATPDYVRVTVRDNISGLDHMSAVFCGKEII